MRANLRRADLVRDHGFGLLTLRLTLRRTHIPDAGEKDWSVVLDGGEIIGRIYRAPNRQGDPWLWGLNKYPSFAANSGYAPNLDTAKAKFRVRWEALGPAAPLLSGHPDEV